MVDKLITIIQRARIEKGALRMFVLLKQSDDLVKWAVYVSAGWASGNEFNNGFSYLSGLFRAGLSPWELDEIGSIGILEENDPFVQDVTDKIMTFESPVELRDQVWAGVPIARAIVLVSISAGAVQMSAGSDISSIDPTLNPSLNPNMNPSINPIMNPTINPIMNPTISPITNPGINPLTNPTINIQTNPAINPAMNPHLNPRLNLSLNSRLSGQGQFLYDKQKKKLGYVVNTNNRVILIFNMEDNLQYFGVHTAVRITNLFDPSANWRGYLVPVGQSGLFNHFGNNGDWLGWLL